MCVLASTLYWGRNFRNPSKGYWGVRETWEDPLVGTKVFTSWIHRDMLHSSLTQPQQVPHFASTRCPGRLVHSPGFVDRWGRSVVDLHSGGPVLLQQPTTLTRRQDKVSGGNLAWGGNLHRNFSVLLGCGLYCGAGILHGVGLELLWPFTVGCAAEGWRKLQSMQSRKPRVCYFFYVESNNSLVWEDVEKQMSDSHFLACISGIS